MGGKWGRKYQQIYKNEKNTVKYKPYNIQWY